MKVLALLLVAPLIAITGNRCNNKNTSAPATKYRARLEIKALCMNYTLRLTEGSPDTSMISTSWTNETTGKSYTNVFGLANPCTFPASLKEGDEFYFVIDSSGSHDCAVCMAYYPTPPKKLSIKVLPE